MAAANSTTRTRAPVLPLPPVKSPYRRKGFSQFHTLRFKVGLGDVHVAAEMCGVTTRTIQNWDKKGAPVMAMRLLHLYDLQHLHGHGRDWAGWMFSRGALIHKRKGLRFCPRNLERLPYLHEVFDRWQSAINRYAQDGIPLAEAWRMMTGLPVRQIDDDSLPLPLLGQPGQGGFHV